MTKVTVACSQCGLRFAVRDNGYADPSRTMWCPMCGSREVQRAVAVETQAVEPQQAA
jgi:predicted RNA-binding Zn-ribbon protein involved in translation (DUF1610 family)